MISFCNFLIRWGFYALFLFVPLIFTGNTSELFEFNKMWLTFGLTLIIGAAWISKMLIERQIKFFKTPLDIPILVFLLSQVLSTIFSIDPHTSLWGYYSRFNGGLLSLFAYGFLYFAFVNNISPRQAMRFIYISIASAVLVALWGFPSHFGYDPTCLLFRGTLDVSCWTSAFQPKVRIFSTLGQPDWLAAYVAFMLPISISFSLIFWKAKKKVLAYVFLGITALFYADLLFTGSRSGFLAFAVALALFLVVYIIWQWRSFAKHSLFKAFKDNVFFLISIAAILLVTFLISAPVSPLDKFSLRGIQTILSQEKTVNKALTTHQTVTQTPSSIPTEELGGTDSGKIRLFVWEGALKIFLHYPIFGTGVETFGYAYYLYRPAGHNLTSEWDYLYNKAHNEFLNYLATTGIVGFGTYMVILGFALWIMLSELWKTKEYPQRLLLLAFLTGYITILITNFFGFSVVIMNIYLFLAPAFVLVLTNTVNPEKAYVLGNSPKDNRINEAAWVGIGIAWLVALYCIVTLIIFWIADVNYAEGFNLDQANQYQMAYNFLHTAVSMRPSEPTFQDELSVNDAVLSTALFQQKDSTNGTKLRDEAITVSNNLVTQHPAVVTFWKDRVRVFYTLSQVNPQYLSFALEAIQKASRLAPTDAKVWYNLGLLYDQTGNVDNAIATEKQTIILKPDYKDAYYALALFYRQKALGGDMNATTVKDTASEQQAVDEMHFILKNFGPDPNITKTLSSWGEK